MMTSNLMQSFFEAFVRAIPQAVSVFLIAVGIVFVLTLLGRNWNT